MRISLWERESGVWWDPVERWRRGDGGEEGEESRRRKIRRMERKRVE